MRILYETLNRLLQNPKLITDSRMSVVNGVEDITYYGKQILDQPNAFISVYEDKREHKICDIAECVAKIILAETYYQANDCYNALIMVNSALAYLEKKDYIEIWAVARYVQLCIMIVTGQLKAIFPLVNSMKEDVLKSQNEQLIINYNALVTWCALYDDDWDIVNEWMEEKAPNEYESIEQKDALCCFVKARIYYFQGKYYSLITLLQALENVLKDKNRTMQMCELYMLMAMALYADNHKDEAYKYIDKIIADCTQREFVRLLADEGEPIYRIIKDYLEICEQKDDRQIKYLKKVRKAAKAMALEFPHYLKGHMFDIYNLTKREQEILNLLASNRSNQEIADFFGCSTNTVKYHLKNIFKKLDVSNRKDAVFAAKNIYR